MSDIAVTALASVLGTVLVALASVVVAFFGPERRASIEREKALIAAAEDERRSRAEAFFAALTKLASKAQATGLTVPEAHNARMHFTASLTNGQGAAGAYTAAVLRRVINDLNDPHSSMTREFIAEAADRTFAWLRGDRATLDAFAIIGADWNPQVIERDTF